MTLASITAAKNIEASNHRRAFAIAKRVIIGYGNASTAYANLAGISAGRVIAVVYSGNRGNERNLSAK